MEKFFWMPAHTSAARMASAPPSNSAGCAIAWVDWRANRLVDALAKSAAAATRLPQSVFSWIQQAEALQRHQAAVLGLVTHAANHFERQVLQADGSMRTQILRDSAGQRPRQPRTWKRYPPRQDQQTLVDTPSSASNSTAVPRGRAPREQRKHLSDAHQQQERVQDARRVATYLASTQLTPCRGPTGAERLDALRARVRAREAEDRAWDNARRHAANFYE